MASCPARAGLPRLEGARTVFPAYPEEVAAPLEALLEMGVGLFAGCCGTTPRHIRALREGLGRLGRRAARSLPDERAARLSCRVTVTLLGGRSPLRAVGVRLYPPAREGLAEAVRAGDFSPYREDARRQAEAGAEVVDVNVGVPGIDVKAIHTPGHSPGSMTFVTGEALIVGDVLFAGSVGRTDFPMSDWATLVASVRDVLFGFDDDTRVCPGHGPETTIGHERRTNPFVGDRTAGTEG